MILTTEPVHINVYQLMCHEGIYGLGPIDPFAVVDAINQWLVEATHTLDITVIYTDLNSHLTVRVEPEHQGGRVSYPVRRVHTQEEARAELPLHVQRILDDLNETSLILKK